MAVMGHINTQTKSGAVPAAAVAVGASVVQRKCDSCADDEVQLKPMGISLPNNILQKQDEDDLPSPDASPEEEEDIELFPPNVFHFPPISGALPPLPELGPTALSIDWFSMSRPYYDRGVPHLRFGDHDAIQQRWLDTFSLARQLGFNPDRSSWISNQLTPMAIDAALVNDYPTTFELMNREMNVSPMMLNAPAIHFKLNVGGANDSFEQEADHIAEQVMRMPEQAVQRKCTACEENEIQAKPLATAITPLVQTKGAGVQETPSWIETQINEAKGGGGHLPDETRSFMECSIGADFSGVRVHTDSRSEQLNRSLNAKAFTVGSDVFFGAGKYNPNTKEGKGLLAHELTHTIQQGGTTQGLNRRAELIQRDKIDHQTLTWDNFKGKVPKKTKFEAVTASDIHDPEVTKIKPDKPEITESEALCGEEVSGGYKVVLLYDTSRIKVKAYFDEENSWKKPWTSDSKVQEKRCEKEIVAPCNTTLDKGEKDAKSKAAKDIADCEEEAGKLEDGAYLIYDCDDKKVKVYKKDECNIKLKDCFEKQYLSGISWSYTAHTGDSISANKKSDCDSRVLTECRTVLMPNLSADLLSHEQGHFDITHTIAKQIERDLKEKADDLKTEAEGCSEEETIKKARALLKSKKPDEAFLKIWKNGKKKLKETQIQYDSETNHSTISAKQTDWLEKIAVEDI